MIWLTGFIFGAAFTGIIAIAVIWRDIERRETAHDRYVREWRKANQLWARHPRSVKHRRHEAPLPLKWW